jgi:trimeric autotransporter adhesin
MAMFPKIVCSQSVRRIAASFSAAFILAGLGSVSMSAQATSQAVTPLVTNRLVQPINENARLTLKGTVHPLANAANDRGAVPDGMQLDRIQVVLKRSSAQESALQQLISEMHTPHSASYHKWLTPEQFGAQFGASDSDIATVEAWLQSKGFSVTKLNPGKQTLEIAGSAGQFRTAFSAQIHKYSVNGNTHYSNASDPQIPAALAPVFGGFASLNNFSPKRQSHVLGKATYNPKTDKATPQWTWGDNTGISFVLAPADFNVQYDLGPVLAAGTTGTGQNIAIVNDSNINVGFVNQYRALFGLPVNPPQVIIDGNDPGVDGVNNPDGPNGDSSEAYLDVELSGAVAPNATVTLVTAADTALQSGLILALERAIYGNVAPVLSISFGFGCESQLGSYNQYINGLWEQAAAQGITGIVSAGDNGSAACDNDNNEYATGGLGISGLASTPYNVAVGGTDFYYSDYLSGAASTSNYWNTTPSQLPAVSILGVIPEQPWNNSQYGLNAVNYYTDITGSTATTIVGGSGGSSTCGNPTLDANNNVTACVGYAKPAWQTGFGDANRDIPDVSLFAANGQNYSYYPVCAVDGDCQTPSGSDLVQFTGIGGTSASAPAFAGIMALVNQKYGPQGQADFVLYKMATQFPAAFHDVTVGNNSEPCASGGTDCIAVTDPLTVGGITEGQLGSGTTPGYNAGVGYDLASGLGTLDVNQLITNWANVSFTGTTTTLTPSSTSFTHGTAITVSGTVTPASGTASGSVALMTDSPESSQQGQSLSTGLAGSSSLFTLTNDAFTGSVNYLPGGTYNIWGHYSGDGTNAAGTSTKTQITVNPEASSTYLNVFDAATGYGNGAAIASGGSASYGTQLIVSAEPVPSTYYNQCLAPSSPPSSCSTITYTQPTGTVAFNDGGNVVNTAVLNSEGDAEYNAPWAVGSHSITASYPGDNSYTLSSSSPFTFTIIRNIPLIAASTVLSTQSSVPAGVAGQATAVLIQVANSANLASEGTYSLTYSTPVTPPTGTVTISGAPSGVAATATLVPNTDAGSAATSSSAQVIFPSTTAAGTYTLNINYAGDSNYSAAQPAQVQVQIISGGTASTTTATATGSVSPTTSITITGTVTGSTGGPAPTNPASGAGIVVVGSGYEVGSTSVVPGTGNSSTFAVVLNSQSLVQGANFITVQYLGDNTYNPSSVVLANPISNPLSDFTMVPEATTIVIPSAGTTTDIVNLSSTNGFAGAVNLTCTGTGGVLCSLDSAAPSLTSGGQAAVTLTLTNGNVPTAGTYNVIVTGTDATGGYVHTLGLSVVAQATTAAPGLTLTGPSGLTIQTPGDSATGTLTVAPTGGLTGATSFDCNITGAPAGITCSAPATAVGGTTSTLTVATTDAVAIGNYTAVVTATQGTVTSQPLSIPIIVNAAAALALTNSGAVTIATPGATSANTSTITVTPTSFTGTVNLTCALTTSPTGATKVPTCTIPATVTVASATTAVTATLTVSTTAATTSKLERPLDRLFAVGGGIALAGLLFFGIPARRHSWKSILGLLVFAAVVGMGIGCGSGGSSGGGGGGGGTAGTTAGAYAITVTGVDAATGKITGSTIVNVTVN